MWTNGKLSTSPKIIIPFLKIKDAPSNLDYLIAICSGEEGKPWEGGCMKEMPLFIVQQKFPLRQKDAMPSSTQN